MILKVEFEVKQNTLTDCSSDKFFQNADALSCYLYYDACTAGQKAEYHSIPYWVVSERISETTVSLSQTNLSVGDELTLNLKRSISLSDVGNWLNTDYYPEPSKPIWGWEVVVPEGFEYIAGQAITIKGNKYDPVTKAIVKTPASETTIPISNVSWNATTRTLIIPSPNVYLGDITVDIPIRFTGTPDVGNNTGVLNQTITTSMKLWIANKTEATPQVNNCGSYCAGKETKEVFYLLQTESGFNIESFNVERRSFGYPQILDGNYDYTGRSVMTYDQAAAAGVNFHVASPNDNVNISTVIAPGAVNLTDYNAFNIKFSYVGPDYEDAYLQYISGYSSYMITYTPAGGGTVKTIEVPLANGSAFTSNGTTFNISLNIRSALTNGTTGLGITSFSEGDKIQVDLKCRVKNGFTGDSNGTYRVFKEGLFKLDGFRVDATLTSTNGDLGNARMIDNDFYLVNNGPEDWPSPEWGVDMGAHSYGDDASGYGIFKRYSPSITNSVYDEVYVNESRPNIALPTGNVLASATFPGIFAADHVRLFVYRNEENLIQGIYSEPVYEAYELILGEDYTIVQSNGKSEYVFNATDKMKKIMTEVYYNPDTSPDQLLFAIRFEGNGVCIADADEDRRAVFGFSMFSTAYPTSASPEQESVTHSTSDGYTIYIEGSRFSYSITATGDEGANINDLTTKNISWDLSINNTLPASTWWSSYGHESLPHSYIAIEDPDNSLKASTVKLDVSKRIAELDGLYEDWLDGRTEQEIEGYKNDPDMNWWYYSFKRYSEGLNNLKAAAGSDGLIEPYRITTVGGGTRYEFRLGELYVELQQSMVLQLVAEINPRQGGYQNTANLNVIYGANAGAYPDPWAGFTQYNTTFEECPSCDQAKLPLAFYTRLQDFSTAVRILSGELRYNGAIGPYPANQDYWIDFDGDGKYDPSKGDIYVFAAGNSTITLNNGVPVGAEKFTYAVADALTGATGHTGPTGGETTTSAIMIHDSFCDAANLFFTLCNSDEKTTVSDPHIFIRVPQNMKLVDGSIYYQYGGSNSNDVSIEELGVNASGEMQYIIRPNADITLAPYINLGGDASLDRIHFGYSLVAQCGYITGTRTYTELRITTDLGVETKQPPVQPVIFYKSDYTNGDAPNIQFKSTAVVLTDKDGGNSQILSADVNDATVLKPADYRDGEFNLSAAFDWQLNGTVGFKSNTSIYITLPVGLELVSGTLTLPDGINLNGASKVTDFLPVDGANRYNANMGKTAFDVPFQNAIIQLTVRPNDLVLTDCDIHEIEIGYGIIAETGDDCDMGCEDIFNRIGKYTYYIQYDNADLDLSKVRVSVNTSNNNLLISGTVTNNSSSTYTGTVRLYADPTGNGLTGNDTKLGETAEITIPAGETVSIPVGSIITVSDVSLLCNLIVACPSACSPQPVTLQMSADDSNEICINLPTSIGVKPNVDHTYLWFVNGVAMTSNSQSGFVLSSYTAATPTFTYTDALVPNGQMLYLTLHVDNGSCSYDVNCPIKVTAESSNWKGTRSADWNDWENWTNGVPNKCTNIVIEENAPHYPKLTPEMNARCAHIHFEMHGEVEKTNLLDYDHATIDLRLTPDKWYMLSAPLQKMYTGDYWLAPHGVQNNQGYKATGDFWRAETDASNITCKDANGDPWYRRHNHTVYMQLYQQANPSTRVTSVTPGGHFDMAKWSEPFNTLDVELKGGWGFVTGISNDTGSKGEDKSTINTFRFPRPETEYEYFYRSSRLPSGIKTSTLVRNQGDAVTIPYRKEPLPEYGLPAMTEYQNASSYRLVYDQWTAGDTGLKEFVVDWDDKQTLEIEGFTTMIVGNPFMSHLDFNEFLNQNAGFESHYYIWDGNTFDAFDAGDQISTQPGIWSDNALIAPMQSFIVEKKNRTNKITSIAFTPAMSVTAPVGNRLRSDVVSPVLNVEVFREDVRESGAALMLNSNDACIATLFSEENTDPAVVFFRKNDAAFSILKKRTLDEKGEEIGILTGKTGTLTLRFNGVENVAGDQKLYLEDRLKGRLHDLTKDPEYTFETVTTGVKGRFFLKAEGGFTGIDELSGSEIKVYANEGTVSVSSGTDDPINSIYVYNVLGQLIFSQQNLNVSHQEFNLKGTQSVVVKVKTRNNIYTQKLLIK